MSRHAYGKCAICGRWRKRSEMDRAEVAGCPDGPVVVAWYTCRIEEGRKHRDFTAETMRKWDHLRRVTDHSPCLT